MATRPSDQIAAEQAALRRVATLVARSATPEEVYAAVTAEVGRVLDVDFTILTQYAPDRAAVVVGAWAGRSNLPLPIGTRLPFGGRNVHERVFRTRGPARIDDYTGTSGAAADLAREWGFYSAVGVPISVDGRPWGVMTVAYTREELLPADVETRLAEFTDLVATALANAQARVELRGFAEEQAALRRVATLVARAAPPEEVFAAVTAEVGRVVDVEAVSMNRYDPDGSVTVVGMSGTAGAPVGTRVRLGGHNVLTTVSETGRTARIDHYGVEASGPSADLARRFGARSLVGVPIKVEGRLWGVMVAASLDRESLPADIETRLGAFTEIAATAVANAQARVELRGFAEEQAALRRVATLVARAAPPQEVFAAVSAEVGQLLGCDYTLMNRYDPDQCVTVVGVWGRTDDAMPVAVGHRTPFEGRNVSSQVFETRRPARIDNYGPGAGPGPAPFVAAGVRSVVGAPIIVEGRLWGVMMVITIEQPLPAYAETRLAGFTELVATAVANADSQAALVASRARIVATADATRRRIGRDLHDGAQQRLVSLALQVRAMQAAAQTSSDQLGAQLAGLSDGLTGALDELRETARGIHPAALTEGGLHPALKTLARRSAVPVRLDVRVDERLPEPIELAAYYIVAEALTNTAKHAQASVADVAMEVTDGVLAIRVRDDGRGGATFSGGSGLVGLTDRVEALGGRLAMHSPVGVGTTVEITLPLDGQNGVEPAVRGQG